MSRYIWNAIQLQKENGCYKDIEWIYQAVADKHGIAPFNVIEPDIVLSVEGEAAPPDNFKRYLKLVTDADPRPSNRSTVPDIQIPNTYELDSFGRVTNNDYLQSSELWNWYLLDWQDTITALGYTFFSIDNPFVWIIGPNNGATWASENWTGIYQNNTLVHTWESVETLEYLSNYTIKKRQLQTKLAYGTFYRKGFAYYRPNDLRYYLWSPYDMTNYTYNIYWFDANGNSPDGFVCLNDTDPWYFEPMASGYSYGWWCKESNIHLIEQTITDTISSENKENTQTILDNLLDSIPDNVDMGEYLQNQNESNYVYVYYAPVYTYDNNGWLNMEIKHNRFYIPTRNLENDPVSEYTAIGYQVGVSNHTVNLENIYNTYPTNLYYPMGDGIKQFKISVTSPVRCVKSRGKFYCPQEYRKKLIANDPEDGVYMGVIHPTTADDYTPIVPRLEAAVDEYEDWTELQECSVVQEGCNVTWWTLDAPTLTEGQEKRGAWWTIRKGYDCEDKTIS